MLAALRIVSYLLPITAIVASIGFFTPTLEKFFKTDYVAECGDETVFPTTKISNSKIDEHLSHYKFIDGIPHWDYEGERGVQANPYQIAFVGATLLQRYCTTKDQSDFDRALVMRAWLVDYLKQRIYVGDVPRVEYDFPNPPYTDKPGWGSAFAQAMLLHFAYRLHPRYSPEDEEILSQAAEAFTLDISEQGLHSIYHGNVIWEEVATNKPSLIVNGHIVAIWNLDHAIPYMPSSKLKRKLRKMNASAKAAVVEFAPRVQLSSTDMLYDLRSLSDNTIHDPPYHRGSYPWNIMVFGYQYLIDQGYNLKGPLSGLKEMIPVTRK